MLSTSNEDNNMYFCIIYSMSKSEYSENNMPTILILHESHGSTTSTREEETYHKNELV